MKNNYYYTEDNQREQQIFHRDIFVRRVNHEAVIDCFGNDTNSETVSYFHVKKSFYF